MCHVQELNRLYDALCMLYGLCFMNKILHEPNSSKSTPQHIPIDAGLNYIFILWGSYSTAHNWISQFWYQKACTPNGEKQVQSKIVGFVLLVLPLEC